MRVLRVLRQIPWSPLVCFGVAWLLMQTEVMHELTWRSLDWRTNFRAYFQQAPDPRIEVILFEDNTDTNLVSWPPDRAYHGALTELLSLAEPAVVTWDVILITSREGGGDESMGRGVKAAMARGTKVVSGSVTNTEPESETGNVASMTQPFSQVIGDVSRVRGDEFALLPFPEIRAVSYYGFVDAQPGRDGIVRELPMVVRVGNELYPSLSLQTAMAYYHLKADVVRVVLGDAVYLPTKEGEVRVPISQEGLYFINYRYDRDPRDEDRLEFPTGSYGSVLLRLNDHFVTKQGETPPPPDYRGKIVLIGQTVTGKADIGPTPRSASAPLVLLHANAVNNILTRDFAHKAPAWAVWLGLLALGYLGTVSVTRGSLTLMISFALLVIVAYTNLAFWGWVGWNWWFPWVGPLLGFTGLQFVTIGRRVLHEQQGKEQIRQSFNSYLSPGLLKRVLKDQGLSAVESERREVTVLFSDLRDFTSWSERTAEDVLIKQLNEYLAAMVECIHEQGGTLHKFIGDAVMAVWGDLVPGDPKRDATRAVSAAWAMQQRLTDLNRDWAARGLETLRMGIGLNHGQVLVGNIGSPRRMEFTVIGDAVNLAARLESLNKEMGTEILVGESVKDFVECTFSLRSIGGVQVKGKESEVQVFAVLAKRL